MRISTSSEARQRKILRYTRVYVNTLYRVSARATMTAVFVVVVLVLVHATYACVYAVYVCTCAYAVVCVGRVGMQRPDCSRLFATYIASRLPRTISHIAFSSRLNWFAFARRPSLTIACTAEFASGAPRLPLSPCLSLSCTDFPYISRAPIFQKRILCNSADRAVTTGEAWLMIKKASGKQRTTTTTVHLLSAQRRRRRRESPVLSFGHTEKQSVDRVHVPYQTYTHTAQQVLRY